MNNTHHLQVRKILSSLLNLGSSLLYICALVWNYLFALYQTNWRSLPTSSMIIWLQNNARPSNKWRTCCLDPPIKAGILWFCQRPCMKERRLGNFAILIAIGGWLLIHLFPFSEKDYGTHSLRGVFLYPIHLKYWPCTIITGPPEEADDGGKTIFLCLDTPFWRANTYHTWLVGDYNPFSDPSCLIFLFLALYYSRKLGYFT